MSGGDRIVFDGVILGYRLTGYTATVATPPIPPALLMLVTALLGLGAAGGRLTDLR